MSGMIDESQFGGQVVAIWRAPFAEGMARMVPFPAGSTLADMVAAMDFLPPDFDRRGSVLIAGHVIGRKHWSRVTPKSGVRVTFHYALGDGGDEGGGRRGKSGILGLVIAVAAVAASVFTLGGGFAFLGASFAPNALGAKLLAGAFSLAGSLASAALTPPPVRPNQGPSQERQKGPASASGNLLGAGAAIPRVVGTRVAYPAMGTQPFTYREGNDEIVEALFALAGPHDLTDIKIGDAPIDDAEDVEHQIREGWPGDTPIDLFQRYAVTKTPGIELSAHDVVDDEQRKLRNQVDPAKSLPRWHAAGAADTPDEIRIDLTLPEGLYDNGNAGQRQMIPFRVKMTDLATGAVYHLPEMLYASNDAREIRASINLFWGSDFEQLPAMPANEGWIAFYKSVPAQVSPPMGGWTAHSSFYSSGDVFLVAGNEATTGVRRVKAEGDLVTIMLDAGSIPKSRYQVEVKRGATVRAGDFSKNASYTLSGTVQDFFGYIVSGSEARVVKARENLADRVGFVRLSSVFNRHPVFGGQGGSGLALIAVKARNRQLDALSVVASGYVKDWDGAGWNSWTTTSNPAPHFHDVLRGPLTPDPLDLDLIDNDSLVEWRQACIDGGFTVDTICEGEAIHDLLNRIAGCGYARPRASETWGVIRDYDRSGEDPVQVFTSRNSSGLSMSKAFARLPDAFRAVYTDENGIDQEEIVYRPGFEDTVNPRIEEVRYDGIKTRAAARARALFDLKQADLRSTFWSAAAPVEALVATRGDLIGVNHDVIDKTHASARIVDVEVEGGEVIALHLDSAVPLYNEPAWEDIAAFEGVEAVEMIGLQSSIGIRQSDGLFSVHAIEGATGQRDTIVLATPVAVALDDDDLPVIREDNLVFLGRAGSETMRLVVHSIDYDSNQTASITAVDEAPSLFPIAA